MPCDVVCISHARGAGGERVGELVAGRLGYRRMDEEIVARAAAREKVDPAIVADAERRKSFFERLFSEPSAAAGIDLGAGQVAVALSQDSGAFAGESHYRDLIREAILDVAAQGKAVIVSHAASYALAGRPGVLRVFVTASPDVRAGRLATDLGLDSHAGEKAVKESDRARTDYLRRFYGVGHEAPTDYDLVVSTDLLTFEQAADAIARTAALLD